MKHERQIRRAEIAAAVIIMGAGAWWLAPYAFAIGWLMGAM